MQPMAKSLFSSAELQKALAQPVPGEKKGNSKVLAHLEDEDSLFRLSRTLIDCIGAIKEGVGIHFVTNGAWDMADLLFYILDQVQPATVSFCTWQINEDAVRKLNIAMQKGHITQLNAVLDRRIKIRNESALEFIKQFGNVNHAADCHAKVLVVRGQGKTVTVIGSANMTTNRRIEAGYLSTNENVADFHEGWLLEQLNDKLVIV